MFYYKVWMFFLFSVKLMFIYLFILGPCYVCGINAVCTARDHGALCSCPPYYIGNAYDQERGCYEGMS